MKGKRIRILSLLMAVSMVTAVAAGCSQKSKDSAVSSAKQVKLTWWTYKNSDQTFMQTYIDKFNKTNKDGITINYVVQTSNNFRQALQLAFQSNQAPDLFTGQDLASYYVPKNEVEPLDKYISSSMKSRFGKYYSSEGDNSVNGKIYSLPSQGITYRLMYNKDLFKQVGIANPPATLDEMVADAKKITQMGKSQGIYGFAINLKNTQTAMERSVNMVGMASGFRYYDYKTGKYDFTPYKPILTAFHQIVADNSMFPGYESLDIDPLRTQFINGKIGMYFGGAWEPSAYVGLNPKATINYGAAQVPTVSGVKGATFISGLRWLFMSSKTQYKSQVWKVMDYFYSDDVQSDYQKQGLGLVVIPSVTAKNIKSTLSGMNDFQPTNRDAIYPAAPNESALAIQGQTFDAVFAAVIEGSSSFDKVVGGLNDKYNTALQSAIKDGSVKDYKNANYDPSSLITKK